jgi:para-nitrobenzyl esterase
LRLRAFAAAAALAATAASAQPAAPTVAVPGGEVGGEVVGGALVFRAIPYDAPPLADLRWRPPQPVRPWQGVRNATQNGPACLQNSEGWNKANWLHASEDCLTLDVKTASLTGKRPVMVWIHGGSNRSGSSGGPADSDLTQQGVVAVALQYRLGVLGFLSSPELSAEQGGASGNYALMDQIAALQWVHDNIARFGGDPGNVTIYGESAGSQDVSLLLAAPGAQGLFHKAILESGTPGFGMTFRPLAEAEKLGAELAEKADATGDLAKLRRLSPVALLTLQEQLHDPLAQHGEANWLRTTIDGKVLPRAPDLLIADNKPKPVIIGTNKVEFGPSAGSIESTKLATLAETWFGAHAAEAAAAYQAEQAPDPRRAHLEMRIQSDGEFHCPADRLADLLANHGWPVWRYSFDVGENGGFTRHAYEIGWVFERKALPGGVAMQDYWAALAVSGDPNGKAGRTAPRPKWQRWDPAKPRQMAFGQEQTAMEAGKPRAPFCRFTENY